MLKVISNSEQNLLRVQVDSNFMWWFQEFPQYINIMAICNPNVDNPVTKNIVYPEVLLN